MKKNIFLIFSVIILLSCKKNNSESVSDGFIINGDIEKSFNGSKVFLKTQESGVLIVLDSTIIKNGTFEFTGNIGKPEVYGIFIDSIKEAIGLFMENTTITIIANIKDLSSSKITGSKTNDDYLDFIKISNQIISEMNILFPEFQKARAENDVIKLEEINKKMQVINDKNTAFVLRYARQNPESYISAVAIQSVLRIPSINKDSITIIYDNFSDYVKKGDYAKEIEDYLQTQQTINSIQN